MFELLCTLVGWWWGRRARETRENVALERTFTSDARERLRDVESRVADALRELAATRENAQEALKLQKAVNSLAVDMKAVALMVDQLSEAMKTGLQQANDTARQALNVTKGGKGRAGARELADFGEQVRELSQTPEGRAALVQQLQELGPIGVNGASGKGGNSPILGL